MRKIDKTIEQRMALLWGEHIAGDQHFRARTALQHTAKRELPSLPRAGNIAAGQPSQRHKNLQGIAAPGLHHSAAHPDSRTVPPLHVASSSGPALSQRAPAEQCSGRCSGHSAILQQKTPKPHGWPKAACGNRRSGQLCCCLPELVITATRMLQATYLCCPAA